MCVYLYGYINISRSGPQAALSSLLTATINKHGAQGSRFRGASASKTVFGLLVHQWIGDTGGKRCDAECLQSACSVAPFGARRFSRRKKKQGKDACS